METFKESDALDFARPGENGVLVHTMKYDDELGDYYHVRGYLRLTVDVLLEVAQSKRVYVEFDLADPGLNIFPRRVGAQTSSDDVSNTVLENNILTIAEKQADKKNAETITQLGKILKVLNRGQAEPLVYYYQKSGVLTIDLQSIDNKRNVLTMGFLKEINDTKGVNQVVLRMDRHKAPPQLEVCTFTLHRHW